MDKPLIIRILGKKEAVLLDDSVYNLRDVADELRNTIILNLPIESTMKTKNITELKRMQGIIQPILSRLTDDTAIQGYTNSKKFLSKYIEDMNTYINGIINSLETEDFKELTYNTNMLMDCILIY